ncbi:MAG: hypothetical protein JWR09_981 [Mucilaginibacter sp.]|nr:hypothetical protein [Mucilaginibacter sp.]
MKNSAWYHKLWLKKLDQYPLKDDAASSWKEMQDLLNEHLPISNEPVSKKPGKFSGSTIISMLGFVLPAAAMIGAITFVAVKHPFKNKVIHKHHYNKGSAKNLTDSSSFNDSVAKTPPPLNADSSSNITESNKNAAAASNAVINNQAAAVAQANIVKRNNTGNVVQPNIQAGTSKRNSAGNVIQPNQQRGISRDYFSADSVAVNPGSTTAAQLVNVNNKAFFTLPLPGVDDLSGTGLIRRAAAALKASSAGGFSKITVKKQSGSSKSKSIKNQNSGTGAFDFGFEGLTNTSGAGTNLVLGVFGNAQLNQKWQVSAGLRIDLNRALSGTITHASYSRPDTAFKVTDSRKINTISVPVNFEYKVSNTVSIYGGPQFSFSAGQNSHSNKLQAVANYRDTLSHSYSIDSALKYNSISKFNVGISGGVSIRVSPHFYIKGLYQQNITPYSVNTGLGNYKQYYHSVQLGIRYTFKKKQ